MVDANQNASSTNVTEEPADPAKAVTDLLHGFNEGLYYFLDYARTSVDLAQLSAKTALRRVAMGIMTFGVVWMLWVFACLFTLYGLATGLGEYFGERSWLGFVIVGVGLIGTILISKKCRLWLRRRHDLKERLKKYEKQNFDSKKISTNTRPG